MSVRRPLDPQATQSANEQLWAAHPELQGRQLTMSPDPQEAAYRQEWMQAYHEAARNSGRPPATSGRGSVGGSSGSCPVPNSANLQVSVRDAADGTRLAGARVEITGPESRNMTGSDVEFTCIQPGTYSVRATKPNYIEGSTTATVAPQTTNSVTVTLQSETELTVRVTDQATHNPVPGARVTLTGPETRSGTADGAGIVVFRGMNPGSYQVQASADGGRTGRTTANVDPGTSTGADVQIHASGGLRGRVTESAHSAAVLGATVTVDGHPELNRVTDNLGGFDFGQIPVGSYLVRAAKDGLTTFLNVNVTSGAAPAVNLVLTWRDEYDAGTPIHMETEIPWEANLQASAGERLIINVEYTDQDRRRHGTGAWANIPGEGPYELRFVATNARFDNATTGARRKTVAGLRSGNIDLFTDATWDGTSPVTVTLTVVDLAVAKTPPDTGSTKDPDYVHTWTISTRARAHPTSMQCDSGNFGSDQPAPATYDYLMMPEITPPGRPSYRGQSVLESFHAITANFAMADLTDAFKAANPGLTTPDQVARFLFDPGNNGTFVINNTDHIFDRHGGFGPTAAFKPASLTTGIGYTLPQSYSCAGSVVGNYTIRRTHRAGNILINKSGP